MSALRVRRVVTAAVSKGTLSPGCYAVLTGVAMLYVVWVITPHADTDQAIPFVAVALTALGLWNLGRGVWLERNRRRPG